ncbi:MAG TPA: UDP-N-acetylmuramoyl-L-alanyl-D-glutamate--2,6-diaminopimelate ligase [Acidimicrobiia bacterium]|nr:UDP-N-acetylmuramoyl-L-alanyl-D-glutamate--2,6-diaminopimelate ligase [Acidimicrobiia bacterium]
MASAGKTVSELAGQIEGARVVGTSDTLVTDVTHDSRQVSPDSMYLALRGSNVDGHEFVDAAVAGGAVAVCVDHELAAEASQLIVPDTRAIAGVLAAAVHDNPSRTIDVIGVTGTNGKTTVTHFIESIGNDAGLTTGLIGTIQTRYADKTVESVMTTPEATDFQRLLAAMRDEGVALVAMEVSSHALEFGRVAATEFAVAAFTNLSQDHLDFHGDMGSYRAAKERLFREYDVKTAVINIDDAVGRDLAGTVEGDLITVGTVGDVAISGLTPMAGGSRFTISTAWGRTELVAPVLGDFNVSNLAVAAACCLAAGISFDEVAAGMGRVAGVPGRFEIVSGTDPIVVIVDYAHTPEGVARAVETAHTLTYGRVIGLIGAGGDRDRAKRPAMGAAIANADVAVITSDNPRSEDPRAIVDAVVSGVPEDSNLIVEVDRRRAIDMAVDAAGDGDVILVLGRGHEPFQQIAGEKLPFDDRQAAAASLRRRRMSAESGPTSGSIDT